MDKEGDTMSVSKSQKAARDKHDAEHFEYITVKVKKGLKDKIKSRAESVGARSVNAYINKLIEDDMTPTGD